MAYATVEDMRLRFTDRMLADVSDPTGAAVQEDPIRAALEDASAEVDAYLARFALPLPAVPVVLKKHVCNIALYNLLNLRPAGDLEDARKRYQDALSFLEDVAADRINLGLTAAGAPVPADDPHALAFGADRVFTQDTLRAWA